MPIIEIRVKTAQEWTNTLKHLLIKTEPSMSNQISALTQSAAQNGKTLLELLTPRTDVNVSSAKTQLLNSNSQTSSSSNSSTKRQRTKSPNTSLTINQLTQENEAQSVQNLKASIVEIYNIEEFYNENKLITVLAEKYKAVQLKELELVKQLRATNRDKIKQQLLSFSKEDSHDESTHLNSSLNASNSESPRFPLNQKFPINIKCCSCFKSIANSINTNNAQQCKLCLGLFHSKNFFKQTIVQIV